MKALDLAALDNITAEAPDKDGNTETAPRLQVEKAAGEFRVLVEWLQARSIQEKVTAQVFSTLLNGDIQHAIKGRNLYAGDIGEDLDGDWEEDVTAIMETPEGRASTPPELATIAAYVMGMEAANY